MDDSRTLPIDTADDSARGASAALLIRVGRCHAPLNPEPRMLDLMRLGEVHLGRGDRDSLEVQDPRTARMKLDDPWMSGQHARVMPFQAGDDTWHILEDLGSTNGCRVNGQRVVRHQLQHGDLVETGQTFWIYFHAALEDHDQTLALAHADGPVTPLSSVCPPLLQGIGLLHRIAATDIPMLVLGETGTGKEVITREVHRLAGGDGPFVALNCAAIPEGLIESELFGHRRGAFTGATGDKRGVVEEAHGGTLMLDEVGDMPLAAQAKLLRLLQDGSISRVGETSTRKVQVRFIGATHRDLEARVEAETFRGDLFARLNGFCIRLPSLRERREDIGLLMSVFLGRAAPAVSPDLRLTLEAFRAIMLHDWPYNIRELEKVITTAAALLGNGSALKLRHLPDALQALVTAPPEQPARPPSGVMPAAQLPTAEELAAQAQPARRPPRATPALDELRETLGARLREHGGNVSAVARAMDTTRMQIHRWMKRTGLDPADFRE